MSNFGKVFGRITIAVNPQYTSQECSSCGEVVKKSLSTRTHVCRCGCVLDRDINAARNIPSRGLGTVGHETFGLERATLWEMEPLLLLVKTCMSKCCHRTKNSRAFMPGSVNSQETLINQPQEQLQK